MIGITGGTGGLGRILCEMLIAQGHQIKCLVRKNSDTSFLVSDNVTLVYGDITNRDSVREFIKDIDVCVHIAAQVGAASKGSLNFVNVGGTKNICDALLNYNRNCRLIYCSSIVARNYKWYKKYSYSDYTISKYQAQQVVDRYYDKLAITTIYPGYIYGPYDKLLIPSILKMLQNGLPYYVKGGEKDAPIVYIDDLCELFIKCIFNDQAIGKMYVSLEKSAVGIHEMIDIIGSKKNFVTPKKSYPKFVIRMIMKIKSLLGQPTLSLRELNILSNHAIHFNNAQDIGWKQSTNIVDGIQSALDWYYQTDENRRL